MTDSEFKQASAPGPASASASASTPGQGNAYGHLKRVLFAPDAKTADGGERPMSRRRRERLRLRALEVEEDEEDDQATNARWIALVSRTSPSLPPQSYASIPYIRRPSLTHLAAHQNHASEASSRC